jgi:ATP-dependent DNA helicase RecG
MFLACYAEKAGSGILDMIARCRKAGLPEPDFRQAGGQFVQTIWRDWLTADVPAAFGLNDRQEKAIVHLRISGRLSNQEYLELFGVAPITLSPKGP